jgi:hypothetical protein
MATSEPRSRIGWVGHPRSRTIRRHPVVDGGSLLESLESAPPERDADHWVDAPAERVHLLQTLMVSDGSPWVGRSTFLGFVLDPR